MTAGLGIYDTMQYVRPKVSTLVVGQAASMGSLLGHYEVPAFPQSTFPQSVFSHFSLCTEAV